MDINDLKPKEVGDRLRSDDFNTVLEAVKLAIQAIQLENDIPGAISDSDMRIAVKQRGVSGLLGMSVADLVIYLSNHLPEELTRSEFIYEKFAPGSALPDPGREASLFLGAGTYTVPGGASLTLTEQFNVVGWDGEKWVKVLEVPIEVDTSTLVQKSEVKGRPGSQKFDKSDFLADTFVNPEGELRPATGGQKTTTDIPHTDKAQTHVTFSGSSPSGARRVAFLNASKGVISVGAFSGTSLTLPIPTGTEFYRATFEAADDPINREDTFMINYGQVALPYEPFKEVLFSIDGKEVPTPPVVDLSNYYNKEEVDELLIDDEEVIYKGNQLLDINGNYEVSQTISEQGELIPDPFNGFTSELILVKEGETHLSISKSQAVKNRVAFYYENGNFIEGSYTETESITFSVPIPEGAAFFRLYYFRVNDGIFARLRLIMVNYGENPLPWEPYQTRIMTKAVSNQRFDKTKIIRGENLSNTAPVKSSTYTGILTDFIEIDKGVTNIHLRGLGVSTRVLFYDEFKDVIGTRVNISNPSATLERPASAKYVIIGIVQSGNTDETAVNTFILNFSSEPLEVDEYKEQVYELDGYSVYHPSDVVDNGGSGDGGISEIPKHIDDRFMQLSDLYSEDSIVSKNRAFIDSLRRLSDNPVTLKTIHIPNSTGRVLKDAIVPLHIFKGDGNFSGDLFNYVFLGDSVNNDFSDIRFFDGDEMLDATIESSGNYSAEPFDSVSEDFIFADGRYFTGMPGSVIQSSTDLSNWSTVVTGASLAFVDAQGNIYAKKSGSDALTKFYKSTGYTTEKDVIIPPPGTEVPVWRYKNFAVDSFGHIYVGSYQTNFAARIYKTTDFFETVDVVFTPEMSDSQHVHNITIDTTVTPNVIYVSFDGNPNGAGKRSQWISRDYATSWTRDDLEDRLGVPVDSGIAYADGNLMIGVSEGAIKGTPSIYTSINNARSFDIQLWGQNTHTVYQIGGLFLIAGTANNNNKESILWGSYDLINLFKVNYTMYLEKADGTGWGFRYGSYHAIPDPEGGECVIMTNRAPNTPSLKVKVGGDNYSALVFVKVPELPINGLDVEVRNGFLVGEPHFDFWKEDVRGAAYRYPLNERVSKLDYADVNDDAKWHITKGLGRLRTETSTRTIDDLQGMLKLTDFGIEQEVDLVVNPTRGVSISFWFGKEKTENIPTQPILNLGGILIEGSTTARVTIFGEVFTISGVFRTNSIMKPLLLTVTLIGNKFYLYVNNIIYGDFTLGATANQNLTSLLVGKALSSPKQDLYISDLRIYDRVLSYDEVNTLFSKANVLNQ